MVGAEGRTFAGSLESSTLSLLCLAKALHFLLAKFWDRVARQGLVKAGGLRTDLIEKGAGPGAVCIGITGRARLTGNVCEQTR
jgi:hypothetical protein